MGTQTSQQRAALREQRALSKGHQVRVGPSCCPLLPGLLGLGAGQRGSWPARLGA